LWPIPPTGVAQIVDAHQVVCDHTDQAEWTGMINAGKKIDAD
jgi:hypothetical protein